MVVQATADLKYRVGVFSSYFPRCAQWDTATAASELAENLLLPLIEDKIGWPRPRHGELFCAAGARWQAIKDRDVMLSPKLLEALREHWRGLQRKPSAWLFPGNRRQTGDTPIRLREPRILSVGEFLQILEHIPEPFRTMCIVAMCMGLRVSEVLGLKWCDIDWEGSRIAIRQSYVYGKPGAVKTPASQRWMPLDDSLAKKLRQHQLRCASPANKEGWIFANPGTGKPFWPGRIQENWLVPAAAKVGLGRIGWHTFRHSHLR